MNWHDMATAPEQTNILLKLQDGIVVGQCMTLTFWGPGGEARKRKFWVMTAPDSVTAITNAFRIVAEVAPLAWAPLLPDADQVQEAA